MNALLLAAALAAAPSAPVPSERDVRCFRLMAELARAEDSELRALGLASASFFLGRIDAAAPGFDVRGAAPQAGDRAALLRDCSSALGASGFDLGALRRSLEAPEPSS